MLAVLTVHVEIDRMPILDHSFRSRVEPLLFGLEREARRSI
jgi:hypothetical protein